MQSNELLRLAFADLHKELLEDVADLTREELFWRPAEGLNHIGFLFWHILRDEDAVICQAVLRQTELWITGGWPARLGMSEHEQGTGFGSEAVGAVVYEPGLLEAYGTEVWRQTESALAGLDPARLEEALPWSSEWRLANLLTTGCLSHSWSHLGEIRQLRGLRGWKFRE